MDGDGGGEAVFEGTQLLAGPDLCQGAGGIRQVQGGQVQGLAGRAILGIKQGGVLAAPAAGHPLNGAPAVGLSPQQFPGAVRGSVHLQIILIGQHSQHIGGHLRQITAQKQRTAENAPQSEHGAHLIRGKIAHTILRTMVGSVLAQATYRQHIAIRPAAGAGHALPGLAPVKHIMQLVPPVPKIAGHTPHLGVAAQVGQIGNIRRAGREG